MSLPVPVPSLAPLPSPDGSGVYAVSPAESVEQLDTPLEVQKKLEPSLGVRVIASDDPAAGTTAPTSADELPIRASSISVSHGPPSTPQSTLGVPTASTSASPGRRRPPPPIKGILKPPPPPPKPTLGNRLRDLAANVVGGATIPGRTLFDADDPNAASSSSGGLGLNAGGVLGSPGSVSAAVGGTLNALGGRIGAGLSRFGIATGGSPLSTPTASPLRQAVGLPEVFTTPPQFGPSGQPVSEKARQKQPLRRATFVLPSLSITYPISSQGEPWSAKVIEDRQKIESSHRSLLSHRSGAKYWSSSMLVKLYESACKGRDEKPKPGIIRALEAVPAPPRPRQVHLVLDSPSTSSASTSATNSAAASSSTFTLDSPFNRHSAEAFADILSSEWSLADLHLEAGVIEDDAALKPILHALLVSGTLGSLSLAGSRKVRERGWRLLAVFLKRARTLKYVDLSDTNWDRRSIDYLVQALTGTAVRSSPDLGNGDIIGAHSGSGSTGLGINGLDGETPAPQDAYGSFIPHAPLLRDGEHGSSAAVQTLRMDGCGLRSNLLEALAPGVRASDIRNISLRRNRIGPLGAVALALMIRDYPDTAAIPLLSPSATSNGTDLPYSPYAAAAARSRRFINGSPAPSPSLRPVRPSALQSNGTANGLGPDDSLPPIPLIVSNSPGVTSRLLPDAPKTLSSPASSPPPPVPPKHPLIAHGSYTQDSALSATLASVEGRISGPDVGGASMALQRQVRALDGVERIGRVLTLDLKGNEIRNGVTYIAQVLKRNRTLKVLNLSDNRIESAGLVALAEALKYNSTLETLDLSNNPCCGPNLEGVTALRTAFTVNTSLKRLFLSETNVTPEGAISLAEFLPESKSLLHLDLTSNPLDVAGVLALSSGLKNNTLIRCLDVSIPPNNADLAELSQSILQTCIRNTELAASHTVKGKGGEAIWGPIKKSVLVRQVKEAEDLRAQQERVDIASSPEGQAREFVYKLTPDRLVPVCESTGLDLERWLDAGRVARIPGFHAWTPGQLPKEDWKPLVERAKALRERLADEVAGPGTDEGRLARMLELNDSLGAVLELGRTFVPPPRLLLPSQIVAPPPPMPNTSIPEKHNQGVGRGVPQSSPSIARHRRHMRGTSLEISSPNFSIGDSDNDSDADAEELDMVVGRLPNAPQPPIASTSTPRSNRGRGGGDIRLEVDDDTDELAAALREAAITSPVERVGRAWQEEEGEVFRKGTKLGVADDEEVEEHGDVSGEILRQEILDTEVARSPTRRKISMEDEDESGTGPAATGNDKE